MSRNLEMSVVTLLNNTPTLLNVSFESVAWTARWTSVHLNIKLVMSSVDFFCLPLPPSSSQSSVYCVSLLQFLIFVLFSYFWWDALFPLWTMDEVHVRTSASDGGKRGTAAGVTQTGAFSCATKSYFYSDTSDTTSSLLMVFFIGGHLQYFQVLFCKLKRILSLMWKYSVVSHLKILLCCLDQRSLDRLLERHQLSTWKSIN